MRSALPDSHVAVVSALPCGGLHVVRSANLPRMLRREYGRRLHAGDHATWQALRQGRAVASARGRGGLDHAAAAPLGCPVLAGYPGALVAWRAREPFGREELAALDRCAEALRRRGKGRLAKQADGGPRRHYVFDRQGTLIDLWAEGWDELDVRVLRGMVQWTRRWVRSAEPQTPQRLLMQDGQGEQCEFRVMPYRAYPALGEGAFVFFHRQPSAREWAAVRVEQFDADAELARLMPAVAFICREFAGGITLEQIARQAHLSPFHFHRRFTETLGVTPKQFLLDCQIDRAKERLREGRREMMRIARECGFSHQSHFTSRFKQATGHTPTRWRKAQATKRRTDGATKGKRA